MTFASQSTQPKSHRQFARGESITGHCLHELFEAQVLRTPQAIAVEDDRGSSTYSDINRRANRLARYLRCVDVGPDVRVAVCTERCADTVIAVLAIAKAGGAYVPIDPSYPGQRIAYMLADSQPALTIVHRATLSLVSGSHGGAMIVDLDLDAEKWELCDDSDMERCQIGLKPDHLAYVIYTSGSTGVPKGVMVAHRGLANLLTAQLREFEPGASSRILQNASFGFDVFMFELMMALGSGASLHLPPRNAPLIGNALAAFIARRRITHAVLTPTALASLPDTARIDSLQTLILGGEAPSATLVKRWAPGRRLFNAYGPTEITICNMWHKCNGNSDRNPPIGQPIGNTRAYILDDDLRPIPTGETGELYIGGIGLARGYLNRSDLTAERFLASPFSQDHDADCLANTRLYRTGDICRMREDGNIEFLGRNDQQVKLRGHRIELGEIEAALCSYAGVRDSVVLLREDHPGEQRLVAYLVADTVSGDSAGHDEALHAHLSRGLPAYMVPSIFVRLPVLPMTSHGKLDRHALPIPEQRAKSASSDSGGVLHRSEMAEGDVPQGRYELELAKIWSELLRKDRISRHDHFLKVGGHSMLVMRLVTQIADKMNAYIEMADVFARPVLHELAAHIAHAPTPKLPAIFAAPRSGVLPLSFGQQRLWVISQMEGASLAYHIPAGVRLKGRLDRAALRYSLDRIVLRHEVLRTRFTYVDGQPMQVIDPAGAGMTLREHDLRGYTDAQGELERLTDEEAARRFDLERAPAIRAMQLQTAEDEHVLLVTMHHIIADAWSMGIVVNELGILYRAFQAGQADPLPALRLQFADYAVWQRQWLTSGRLQRQAAYWKVALADAPALLDLPTDRPRLPQQSHAGASLVCVLDADITRELKLLGHRHGMTLFMVLLAGWAVLLSRLSGQGQIVIGSPASGRERPEVAPMVGFFVNTLALCVDVVERTTVSDLLRHVKEQVLAAQANQDLPFEQIVELTRPVHSVAHTPLFQAMFSWQNADETSLVMPGLEISAFAPARTTVQFDLALDLREEGETIAGAFAYSTALFDHATIERHCECWKTLLAAMLEGDLKEVSDLPLLSTQQKRQMLSDWNAVKAAEHKARGIHELFESQVARQPQAIALQSGGEALSYAHLNARANRLAHYLLAQGIRPGACIAICMERGFDMLVALLATLKAGACYLPLDPSHPPERLSFMLADSQPAMMLVHRDTRSMGKYERPDFRVLELGADVEHWSMYPDHNPHPSDTGLDPAQLAYIIYTSGSTGTPKGVMVEHRNVLRLFQSTDAWFQFSHDDVWTLFHSFAFDFSVWEIWGALAHGGRLVIVPASVTRAPAEFYRLLCREGVTVLNQTPSAFRQLIAAQGDESEHQSLQHRLRTIIFGGEALESAMLKPWYERPINAGTTLVNMYGITETTVHVTYRPLTVNDAMRTGYSPIGVRIPDLRIYILDDRRQPVPVGISGELYVGGAGVARGYLRRPELTAERFIVDPFAGNSGERMYKTGDLARYLADGSIEYLGRNDFQVKIRGYRIELGEIEARLVTCEEVREAVVIARDEEDGGQQLIAYVVLHENMQADAALLRQALSDTLPGYMLPGAFVFLDSLPLTKNGKLDREALLAMNASTESDAEVDKEMPQGSVEQDLARIWSELLGRRDIGRHDNFFDIGGHSIKAVSAIVRIEIEFAAQFGPGKLSLYEFYQHPTIAEVGTLLARARDAEADALKPLVRFYQKRLVQQRPVLSLVCVPYAGASVDVFRPLNDALSRSDENIAVYGVSVSASEVDGQAHWEQSVESIAQACVDSIVRHVPGEIALYGHCVGSVLACEIAHRLESAGRTVKYVMVGAALPMPKLLKYLPFDDPWRSTSDDHLIKLMYDWGVDIQAESSEVQRHVLGNFRKDARMAYRFQKRHAVSRISAPIVCIVSDDDPLTKNSANVYPRWKAYSDTVRLITLPEGGHYFISRRADAVAERICYLTRQQIGRADDPS